MSDSLYAAIGGREAINSIVKDFYQMVYYDDQLQGYFEETDMDALRAHQQEFLRMVTGGPSTYSVDDLRTAHQDLTVTESDFELVAGYLERALVQNQVSESNRTEILSTVTSYKHTILNQ